MAGETRVKVEIPNPLDLSDKVARQIPFAVSKALNETVAYAREGAAIKMLRAFTTRNNFVESGIGVIRATKTKLEAAVGVEERRAFMGPQIEGGERLPSSDKAGSSIPIAARKNKTDKIGPSKWAGAIIGKDEGRKVRRVFFTQLGTDGLYLARRLKARESRSRGVLKRDYKGRKAGTPLLPREKTELVYAFDKDVKIKKAWPLPALVEADVKAVWHVEMIHAMDKALASAKP